MISQDNSSGVINFNTKLSDNATWQSYIRVGEGDASATSHLYLQPTAANVYVGYTSASGISSYKFAVNGNGYFNGSVTATNYYATGMTTGYLPYIGSSGLLTQSVVYTNGTNIGIGTTSVGTYAMNISGTLNVGTYIYSQGYKVLYANSGYTFLYDPSGSAALTLYNGNHAATFLYTVSATNYYATSLSIGYLPFISTGNLMDNSLIYQSSSKIGVDTTTLIEKFNINGYAYATGYKTPGGTSAGFLKADGSIDTTTTSGISAYGSWSISGGPVTVTSGTTQQVNFDTENVTQVGTITHSGGSFLLSIGYWEINATIYCNNSLVGTTAIMYIMNLDTNTVLYVTECTVSAGGGFGVCTLSEIVEPSSNIHYGIVMDCGPSTTTFDIRDVIGGNICSTLTLKKIG